MSDNQLRIWRTVKERNFLQPTAHIGFIPPHEGRSVLDVSGIWRNIATSALAELPLLVIQLACSLSPPLAWKSTHSLVHSSFHWFCCSICPFLLVDLSFRWLQFKSSWFQFRWLWVTLCTLGTKKMLLDGWLFHVVPFMVIGLDGLDPSRDVLKRSKDSGGFRPWPRFRRSSLRKFLKHGKGKWVWSWASHHGK